MPTLSTASQEAVLALLDDDVDEVVDDDVEDADDGALEPLVLPDDSDDVVLLDAVDEDVLLDDELLPGPRLSVL